MMDMLDCKSVMRQLWDFLDGELTADKMDAIREHLSMCARCQPQSEFAQSFLTAMSQARREHSNPGGLATKVRDALHVKGFAIE
jgi:anti-sigma factor (TIGR02949 family)